MREETSEPGGSRLERYRRKRDPSRTPEPAGDECGTEWHSVLPDEGRERPGWRFVVQKHAARRLHYDFRLELDGVLKSWAVPRGPCLDPTEKRLALHVEDHPIEYAAFEGVIPKGEYGGGTMIIWDRGTWEPEGDAGPQYREGKLKFRLYGEKLRGRWMLVRMKPRPGEKGDNWLLVKERDDEARPLADYDVLAALPDSVQTGRSLEDVAAGREPTFRSQNQPPQNQPRSQAPPGNAQRAPVPNDTPRASRQAPFPLAKLKGAVAARMPTTIRVQLAEPADQPPAGDRWLHEIKFDGYRLLASLEDGRATLTTRNAQNWTDRFPQLAAALEALGPSSAILDGEIVALLPDGTSSLQALQTALSEGKARTLVYFAFDVLYLDGYDLRKVPLERRKDVLAGLLRGRNGVETGVGRSATPSYRREIQYTDHLVGDGPAFFEVCRQRGLEGVVSKRRDRPHRPGRTGDWLKSRCVLREEFVIGGFTEPEGTREGLGAILVGYFDRDQRLVYAGKVGTGFDHRTLRELRERLDAIEQRKNPFADLPREKIDRGTHWVKPCLVAQVEYGNWSGDRLLRYPSFQGLREDLPASAVVRDLPEEEAATGLRVQPAERRANNRREKLSQAQLAELANVRITSPERVFYPECGITKLDLVKFYIEIADWILPHVVGRPLSLLRCPEGVGRSGTPSYGRGPQRFFQKHATAGMPPAIRQVRLRGEEQEYLAIDDLAGLVSLVQLGVLELHPWGARVDRPDKPDRMIFDLDPGPGVEWPAVITAACRIRDVLDELGLASFVKTTGGKGLHVVVPLDRRHSWDDVQAFSKSVGKRVSADAPGRFTLSLAKSARTGRIYIDFLRNARGATAVAAYSTRANENATVSVPLTWDELSPYVGPDHFTVLNLASRLASLEDDPWAGIDDVRQSITAAMRKRLER